MRRYVVGLAVLASSALGAAWWLGLPHGDTAAARDFLGRYCTDCHNEADFTADLVIRPANVEAIAAEPEHWEKIVRKLRAETMPPEGPRPEHTAYVRAAAFLEAELDAAAASAAATRRSARVPAPDAHRVPQRHSRSARAR